MSLRVGLDVGSDTVKTVILHPDNTITTLGITKVLGQPILRVKEALEEVARTTGAQSVICGASGAGAATLHDLIGIDSIHEPNALATSFALLYPDVRTVVEMGRESQKYVLFNQDSASGKLLVEELSLGNKCASGSGSFLDHMAKRLNYESIEEFAKVALEAESPASLSGRCAVFTESDIVHLYQKGTPRDRIAAGVHQAISRNYRSAIARGREFVDKVAFIGGVSENPAAIKYLSEELELGSRLFVPEHKRTLGAIGAALRAESRINIADAIAKLEAQLAKPLDYPGCEPIGIEFSEILTGSNGQADFEVKVIERAALGVDIGSVSTKAALVTMVGGKTVVLASYYRRTDGDPLAAVRDTLSRIHAQVAEKGYIIGKIAAATTGSGRYLTGDYIGADLIRNEITAQASGACAYADDVDTIFEIGGQDSKYVRMDGDVIIDFEMNKACAAGTGAFLEKQASRLGIPLEEFGDRALKNTRPPELDWTCTVFSESAMVYYQQNNVPVEDLAAGICLASVRNYLNKNVASRSIGEKIAFQGAVAFNKGMVAAFETALGRKIVVPPYPHITGAVGAARLAYLANPEEPKFRGFEAVEGSTYEIASFECKSCPNRCDVNTFQVDGGTKYFYNDRCEKFSATQKKKLGEGLPDLFAEHSQMLAEAYTRTAKDGAPTVGIPRAFMFDEYFPLYNAFFTELGYKVVTSDETNKRIVDMGLETAVGEPCFPFKVAHGHYQDLISKGVDIIFSPAVINTEQPNPHLAEAQTCPYLQGAPFVIGKTIGIEEKGVKYLAPCLHFKRGKANVEREFIRLGRELGKNQLKSRAAFRTGYKALEDFRKKVSQRGAEVLANLKPGEMAFVVIARPYTLYDPVINMHIGKRIQDMGILAIPQDFLPLEAVDVSDVWPLAYSRQIQRKLMAARLIRHDTRVKAVVLTYFACGPDSFGNPFFKDELGEPCYVMQIDEHTADAGVITRIEAFADTASKSAAKEYVEVRSTDQSLDHLKGRKLWIPYANDNARVLAKAFQCYGYDSDALPLSPDPGLNLGRKAISEDVCLPALATTEDMLYRVSQPDFDPAKEAFFQGHADGPCRYGMYSQLQRIILDKAGHADADIITLGSRTEHGGLGKMFAVLAWDGFVCHDLLQKMLHRARPYERNPGEADQIFQQYMTRLLDVMPEVNKRLTSSTYAAITDTKHLEPFGKLLTDAQQDFAAIMKQGERRPLVGLVGEFYVRIHERSNQSIIRKLESEGAEVWLAPATEFFAYSNFIGKVLAADSLKERVSVGEMKEFVARWFNARLASKDEHALFHWTLPFLDGYDDVGPDEVIENGSIYMDHHFGGECICSMGKAEDFANRGLAGIISVIPFNCMPGNCVNALSQSLRRRHNNLPFLSLDYDGFTDSSREAKVVNFMWQVKERGAGKDRKQLQETSKEQATARL